MPNFKLGEHYQRIIKENVGRVLENYVKGFSNNFPLTHDEVQHCIIERDLLLQFEALWTAGARTISRSSGVTCFLDRGMTDGLSRSCVLVLTSTHEEGFFTARDAQPYFNDTFKDARERARLITLDLRGLPDQTKAVTEWCHLLIRAVRLRDMVTATVWQALTRCPSTAHLMANWPELATFAKEEDGNLRKRLAAAPAKLDRYKVGEGFLPPKKQRDAANVVLTMGAMALPAAKNADEAEVKGDVYQFEKLPTDPVF